MSSADHAILQSIVRRRMKISRAISTLWISSWSERTSNDGLDTRRSNVLVLDEDEIFSGMSSSRRNGSRHDHKIVNIILPLQRYIHVCGMHRPMYAMNLVNNTRNKYTDTGKQPPSS